MLSKEELKLYKITFWEEFKLHMSKHRSASGRKMNWLQYKTDIKQIFLRLETNKSNVRVCFDIQFKDAGIRSIVWEQMGELKKVLNDEMKEDGVWEEHFWNDTIDDFCRIYWEKSDLNYLDKNNKQAIFNFFEDKLICFDKFYDVYKDILINLIK
jgi:hypothetical protein